MMVLVAVGGFLVAAYTFEKTFGYWILCYGGLFFKVYVITSLLPYHGPSYHGIVVMLPFHPTISDFHVEVGQVL